MRHTARRMRARLLYGPRPLRARREPGAMPPDSWNSPRPTTEFHRAAAITAVNEPQETPSSTSDCERVARLRRMLLQAARRGGQPPSAPALRPRSSAHARVAVPCERVGGNWHVRRSKTRNTTTKPRQTRRRAKRFHLCSPPRAFVAGRGGVGVARGECTGKNIGAISSASDAACVHAALDR